MKQRLFMWGWSNHPQLPDGLMTPQRMAMLMRAWRRARTGGRPEFAFTLTSRAARQASYKVEHLPTGELATFTIVTVPAGRAASSPQGERHAL